MEQQAINDILAAISDLGLRIQENIRPKYNRSEDIKDLATALSKAQAEFDIADLNKINPYFKSSYADLASIVGASRPALTKYGLSVTQEVSNDETGALWLITELMHSTGQWKLSRFRMVPPKNDIQAISSYNTYVKRMCYASLVGVVTGDEDDDGEQAIATTRDTMAKGVALNTKYNPKEINPEVITKEQLEDLEYELSQYEDIAQQVLEGLKLQNLADMPKSKFQIAMKRIREIKLLRNQPAQ